MKVGILEFLGIKANKKFLQGMGSVLDLGGVSPRQEVQIFHAPSPEQAIRSAWETAMGQAEGLTRR